MTRKPDPRSKVARVVLDAKLGQEPQIRAFKEICYRDGLDASDELFQLIHGWLKGHNWPPGNPQTQITNNRFGGAAEEKLSQKHHEKASVDYGSMSLDDLRAETKKRFLSDRERSYIKFFIRQKEALR